ncbi:MAG: hypothetical protein PUG74_11925 [Prevotellaceae bacterium]|nr:hypothetical protein [Prevotellaceae bacterium]
MIKTLIFGNTHGFDFYEQDVDYEDYVKSFYISTRKGKRLMVNRRGNGETLYNYLHYGIKESIDRPTNGLFGMSLVVSDSLFCTDFRKIFEWFDYLFEHIVQEGKILRKDESDTYKYVIGKFSDNKASVEWIKNTLPNIFSEKSDLRLVRYDSSFSDENTGKVAGLNDEESNEDILAVFKKYSWISISSEFPHHTHRNNANSPEIELSYQDLNNLYNRLTNISFKASIGQDRLTEDEFKLMLGKVRNIYDDLQKYLPSISNTEMSGKFEKLRDDYASLHDGIRTLINKTSPSTPPSNRKVCKTCGQEKDISMFRTPDADQCMDCEARYVPKRKCKKCHQLKPQDAFSNRNLICDDCLSKQEGIMCKTCGKRKSKKEFDTGSNICKACLKKPGGIFSSENIFSLDKNKLLQMTGSLNFKNPLLLFLVLLVALGVIYGAYQHFSSNDKVTNTALQETPTLQPGDQKNIVDEKLFNSCYNNNKFAEAYKLLSGKSDGDSYKKQFKKEDVIKEIFTLIDSSNRDSIFTQGIKYIEDNADLLAEVGLNDKINEIEDDLKVYEDINKILGDTNEYITKSEYDNYKKRLQESLVLKDGSESRLKSLKQKITSIEINNKEYVKNKTLDFISGEAITISSTIPSIMYDNKNIDMMETILLQEGTHTIKSGAITITLKVKKTKQSNTREKQVRKVEKNKQSSVKEKQERKEEKPKRH